MLFFRNLLIKIAYLFISKVKNGEKDLFNAFGRGGDHHLPRFLQNYLEKFGCSFFGCGVAQQETNAAQSFHWKVINLTIVICATGHIKERYEIWLAVLESVPARMRLKCIRQIFKRNNFCCQIVAQVLGLSDSMHVAANVHAVKRKPVRHFILVTFSF